MLIRGAGKEVQVEGVAVCPPVDLQLLLPWYLVVVPFNRLGCCSIPGGGSQVSQLVRRRARNLLYHPLFPDAQHRLQAHTGAHLSASQSTEKEKVVGE